MYPVKTVLSAGTNFLEQVGQWLSAAITRYTVQPTWELCWWGDILTVRRSLKTETRLPYKVKYKFLINYDVFGPCPLS